MTSLVYDKFLAHLANNGIDLATDTYKAMLVNGYTPNRATHEFRSDVTSETTGTGYTSGGTTTAVTLSNDTTNHREDCTFANVSWTTATITATAAVIYKSTGTSTTDILVAYVDFGGSVSSTAATFAVTFSSPLRFQL